MTILAQEVADPTAALVQYGAVGLIALLALGAVRVLFSQITSNAAADRARADRLEEELRRTNSDIQDKVLVTLAAAQQAISVALETMREDRR